MIKRTRLKTTQKSLFLLAIIFSISAGCTSDNTSGNNDNLDESVSENSTTTSNATENTIDDENPIIVTITNTVENATDEQGSPLEPIEVPVDNSFEEIEAAAGLAFTIDINTDNLVMNWSPDPINDAIEGELPLGYINQFQFDFSEPILEGKELSIDEESTITPTISKLSDASLLIELTEGTEVADDLGFKVNFE